MGATLQIDPAEDRALTESVALVHRGERGKLAITGEQAAESLDGQLTNAITELAPGSGCYAALLTNKGKMLADVRVIAVPEPHSELWLDTERGALQTLFDALRRGLLGWRAELHKRTLQQGLLSLIGPQARALVDAEDLAHEHACRWTAIGGVEALLIATDLGVDVVCDSEHVEAVKAALAAPEASEAAAEVLRVESGRPRYGVDLDDGVIPQEAGLNERAVSFTKGCYVGQETVARLHYRGKPNRSLRGLLLAAPAPDGTPLTLGEREVGRLTSSVVSPRLGPIALALVRREAEPGAELTAGATTARVVELPFART